MNQQITLFNSHLLLFTTNSLIMGQVEISTNNQAWGGEKNQQNLFANIYLPVPDIIQRLSTRCIESLIEHVTPCFGT